MLQTYFHLSCNLRVARLWTCASCDVLIQPNILPPPGKRRKSIFWWTLESLCSCAHFLINLKTLENGNADHCPILKKKAIKFALMCFKYKPGVFTGCRDLLNTLSSPLCAHGCTSSSDNSCPPQPGKPLPQFGSKEFYCPVFYCAARVACKQNTICLCLCGDQLCRLYFHGSRNAQIVTITKLGRLQLQQENMPQHYELSNTGCGGTGPSTRRWINHVSMWALLTQIGKQCYIFS